MTDFCQLARQAIAHRLSTGRNLEPEGHAGFQAACFVSLHDANGDLRGCMGTLSPNQKDVHLEIIENAVAAATRDPRFSPVTAELLPSLTLEVSILNKPERIHDTSYLDPSKYGVIVEHERKRGVLLPGLDGITEIGQQIRIAKRKAGIPEHQPVLLSRFEVTWHHES